MKKNRKRKRRTPSLTEMVAMVIICLLIITIGLFQTILVIDDWYFLPDYITDNSGALFSGTLFIGLAFLVGAVSAYTRDNGRGERYATWLFLFFIIMAPIWSAGICLLRYKTIAQYKNPQFGVCYRKSSHRKTYMYVRNSDWCQHFDYTIVQPSPAQQAE